MCFLCHVLQQAVHVCAYSLVGDPIDQIRHSFTLGNGLELLGHRLFEEAGHPDNPFEATIGRDELGAGQVVFAHPHHTGGLQTAARHASQRAESHPGWGHAGVLSRDDHHAIRLWDEHHNALKAAAGGHGILHDRVHAHILHRTVAGLLRELGRAGPVSLDRVDGRPLGDRLVGAGRVDLVAGLAVQPVIGATETQPLWCNHANMIGGKGLAEGAGVEIIHSLIGQVGQTAVAEIICLAGFVQPLLNQSGSV